MSTVRVLKFGSSVLRGADDLPRAVVEILRELRAGRRVVAVVSALGSTTDELERSALHWTEGERSRHLPALLATGEARSAALLGLALERAGLPCVVADPPRLGLVAEGEDPLEHTPVSLDLGLLRALLDGAGVVVVPGFTGIDRAGRTVLFGRGGSDLTALFLAERLGASCRLVKDVDGVFEDDPARGGGVRRYEQVDWNTLLGVGGELVQPRSVRWARERGLAFEVGALGGMAATRVGPWTPRAVEAVPASAPLAVALCGLGTVGGGVARLLALEPERTRIVGALVREPGRDRGPALSGIARTDDLGELLAREPRVLVELTGDPSLARAATERALDLGIHVVSADKALLAEHGPGLERRARRGGASLSCAAAVGGVVPMLESVERVARTRGVESLAGVLNGTVQYVLESTRAGLGLDEAVARAQAAGYAEADPRADLEGEDARRKLVLLARAAFGPDTASIHTRAVQGRAVLDEEVVERARAARGCLRLVARARRAADGTVQLDLDWEEHPRDSFLGALTGTSNGLEVIDARGSVERVRGAGAGRWPTATAVLADLEDLRARITTRVGGAW